MFLFFRRRPRAGTVARDVERMLRQYGAEAYRVAGEMSWREDAGLLTAPEDGHWHRVHREIGRRTGHPDPVWTPEQGSKPVTVERPQMRRSTAPVAEPEVCRRVSAPAE